jgi:small conductance mechanosensitive channel
MTASLEYVRHLAEGYLFPSGVRLIVATAVFLIGRALAKAVMRGFDRVMERAKIDISLRKFLGDVGYAVMLLAVVIAALDTLGIKTTAVLAVLGAAGLAVGLALQGSLSNFAAGVMLIVLRPYKVSDIVVIGKYLGRIDAIKVFNTVMITSDYREITIPNGQIIAAPIENLTVLGRRRIDFLVSVPLTTNLATVKATPPPAIEVIEIADTAIKLRLRPWTNSDNYDRLATDLMEQLKTEMQKAGVAFSVALQAQTA